MERHFPWLRGLAAKVGPARRCAYLGIFATDSRRISRERTVAMNLPLPELLALALASAVASGLNAYASVAMIGLLQRYDVIQLPPPMNTLSQDWVIGVALALFAVEFFADKIPYFDNLWDAIHTFIRVPVGAGLAAGFFADQAGPWQALMAVLGGALALQSHGAKASTRLSVNASPEPFSNWALSLGEDALVVFLLWMAASHPYIALAIVAVLAVGFLLLARVIFRGLRRLLARLRGRSDAAPAAGPTTAAGSTP